MVNILNTLKLAMNKVIALFNEKVDKIAITNIFQGYALPITSITAGSGWTITSAQADLGGNYLRIYIAGTRSKTNYGDITNEEVCTIKIDTQGKIHSLYFGTGVVYADGPVSHFCLNSGSLDGNIYTVKITMQCTHTAGTNYSTYIPAVARLNSAAYL